MSLTAHEHSAASSVLPSAVRKLDSDIITLRLPKGSANCCMIQVRAETLQGIFALVSPGRVVPNLVAGAIAEAGAQQAGDMMQVRSGGLQESLCADGRWPCQCLCMPTGA